MFRKLAVSVVATVVLAMGAAPASATEYIFDSDGDAANIYFNGFSGSSSSIIDGLLAHLRLTLLSGAGTNQYVFSYTLTNNSTSGGSGSRASGFAFNASPDVDDVSTLGDIAYIHPGGNYPNAIGKVEICLSGSQACAGPAGGGATLGSPASGTFTLSYDDAPSSVALSDFYVRYQSLSGLTVTSATGGEVTTSVPEPSVWIFMISGFGAVGFAMRRRQKAAGHLTHA